MSKTVQARVLRFVHAQIRDGAVVGLLLLLAMLALKRFYSAAGADALSWVLAPSCWLATHVGGLQLAPEPGAGFISHAPRMVVGPACAGVNFLIVAWLALYGCAQTHYAGVRKKLAFMLACGAGAYLATLATNGVRIVLAAELFDADVYGALLTKDRVHRLLGVALYCSTLLATCHLVARWSSGPARTGTLRARLPPLLWYFGVVLLVPLANRAWTRDPRQFAEHAALTLGAGTLVLCLSFACGAAFNRLHSRRVRS